MDQAPLVFDASARFQIRERLGAGAHGVVYRAFDCETNRDVALKSLAHVDAEQLFRLKAEFRSLSEIEHPSLVPLHELVVSERGSFFTMELLAGQPLDAYLRPNGERGVLASPAVLERIARDVVAAMAKLHEHRKLHRDIKPSNVLVTPDGHAVLVDYGFCLDLARPVRSEGFVGTLRYMAPEQAWGKTIGPAADFYALGAVLYEALLGAPPFEGTGGSLLAQKERGPTLPADLPPSARSLAELAVALMHPNPAARPTLAAIGLALDAAFIKEEVRELPFVGRGTELGVLAAAWGDVCAGRSAIADVRGTSGIGKTELVERFLRSLDRDVVVLRGRCHPRESVPYNGIDGIVDDLSDWLSSLSDARRAGLIGGEASAIADIFPVLARTPGIAARQDGGSLDPFALRQRAFRALRELFVTAGASHRMVVVLDDAQWGGSDTAALVVELMRPEAPRLLFVLASRSEDGPMSPFFVTLAQRAPGMLRSIHRVALGPLTDAAALDIARWALDDDVVAAELTREAGGHPFFLRELALAVAASGRAAAKRDLGSLLGARIEQLADVDQRIIELLAVVNRPVSRRLVLAAAGAFDAGTPRIFSLVRKRLVRETSAAGEPAIEPYHSHVQRAALRALDASAQRARHRQLADTLLAQPDPDADLLVDVLVGAGDRVEAAPYAEVAAERAEQQLAFDRAATLHRLVVDLARERGERGLALAKRLARLASALGTAGDSRSAGEAYAGAAEELRPHDPRGAADQARSSAEHFLRGGHFELGALRMREVLSAADIPYPSSAASAFATMLVNRARLAVRGFGSRPRPESEVPPELLARIDACWSAALGLSWIDRTRTISFHSRLVLLALDAGEPIRVARVLASEASTLACLGGDARVREARALMDRARATLAVDPDPRMRALSLLMEGTIEFYGSSWRRAVALNERADEILRDAGSTSEWERTTSHTLNLAALFYLGELKTLRARQAVFLDDAQARGNRITSACVSNGPANASWLVVDDPDEAARRADLALAPWRKDDFQLAHYLHLVAMSNVELYRGDPRAAMDRLRREWPRVVSSMSLHVQNFRVTLRHLRGRAALAVARRASSRLERYRMLRLARSEAARLAREDVSWARPLGLSIAAGVAALSGRENEALADLGAAADAFEAIDMKLHAWSARRVGARLTGGDRGAQALSRADAWMTSEGVVAGHRLAAALFWG